LEKDIETLGRGREDFLILDLGLGIRNWELDNDIKKYSFWYPELLNHNYSLLGQITFIILANL